MQGINIFFPNLVVTGPLSRIKLKDWDPGRCTVDMSMFVSSKWQRVALPTRWCPCVRALFYCYLTFLDHRTNVSRKVCAPRHVSASGAPNKFQNCHLDKTNMDKTSQHHWALGRHPVEKLFQKSHQWSMIHESRGAAQTARKYSSWKDKFNIL